MSTVTKLISAEEFARMPQPDNPCELIRGEIIEMTPPQPRHGQICARIVYVGLQFNESHDCMHVLCNDTGVITERGPDTVRGPDVWFISYDRLPKGPVEYGTYIDAVPEVVFEVVSPTDRWSEISAKIAEYLTAGVLTVCVLEPELQTVRLFFPDKTSSTHSDDDELTFPGLFPEFSVPIRRFFE